MFSGALAEFPGYRHKIVHALGHQARQTVRPSTTRADSEPEHARAKRVVSFRQTAREYWRARIDSCRRARGNTWPHSDDLSGSDYVLDLIRRGRCRARLTTER